ncbi:MAG TPA: hypothetical protein VHF50_04930 [Solirubrobacterales bacterium]|nr:hypothetical protein [Solirubrobacterales bacterium]
MSALIAPSRLPALLLAAATLASGAWLISLDSQLTFIADDWMLLVKRQGWTLDYFLHPFHGNIVAAPGLVYRLLLEVFGMDSATPFYCVAIATFLASAVLLFLFARRRVGDWLALVAAVLILFLGAAFEDLLFAFQIGYFASVAAGLGMLLALDREDEVGDGIACALAVVSLAFSSVGIPVVAAAVVDVALGRRPRLRRAYVALVPISLYVGWWAGWGHVGQSEVGLDNLLGVPEFVFEAASAGVTSLMGLATGDGSEPEQPNLIWGKLVLIAASLALVAKVAREGKVSRGLAVALALGLVFWAIAGLNRNEDRLPTSSRYQYPSAVFLLLIAVEALRGVRVPRPAVVAAAAATVAAVFGGISLAEREHRERWVPYADSIRSNLAAVEIAGDAGDPNFTVAFAGNLTAPAGTYLGTVAEYGSPAFTESELAERPSAERDTADLTMAQMLGIALASPEPGERVLQCEMRQASPEGHTGVTLLRGGFRLTNRGAGEVEVLLSRFADELSVVLGTLAPGQTTALTIPVDGSDRPWVLGLKGEGPVRLCTAEVPAGG